MLAHMMRSWEVKTTLGPKGMDKILQSLGDEHMRKKITVTNDGATIL